MKRFVYVAVNSAVCVCIAVAVIFLRGAAKEDSVKGVMRCLSDGFFVAGIVSLCMGGFAFIGSRGLLDAFFFTCKRFWIVLHSKAYREKHKIDYIEYREKRRANEKPYAHFLIVGGVFAAFGILFTVLFCVL